MSGVLTPYHSGLSPIHWPACSARLFDPPIMKMFCPKALKLIVLLPMSTRVPPYFACTHSAVFKSSPIVFWALYAISHEPLIVGIEKEGAMNRRVDDTAIVAAINIVRTIRNCFFILVTFQSRFASHRTTCPSLRLRCPRQNLNLIAPRRDQSLILCGNIRDLNIHRPRYPSQQLLQCIL